MTTYRHTLTRHLRSYEASGPGVVMVNRWLGVVMVNPSLATADFVDDKTSNDNTIRSLIRIAEHNGFDAISVANVSPYIATAPPDLIAAIAAGVDVFDHQENDLVLAELTCRCDVVVCAWGVTPLKHRALERRASEVRELLLGYKPVLHCFGRTKDGWPKHPLFLPRATALSVFATRGAA